MQWHQLCDDLEQCRIKQRASRISIQGEFAVAGRLTAELMTGGLQGLGPRGRIYVSDSATIKFGAYVINTAKAASARGRVRDDHFVYIPFFKASGKPEACVMEIHTLLRVHQPGMGWPDDEARLAVGKLYTNLQVRKGLGLETAYNDNPARGAYCYPRLLYANQACRENAYTWVVHLRQILCPVCFYAQSAGTTFVTTSKIGFHGRRDFHWRE